MESSHTVQTSEKELKFLTDCTSEYVHCMSNTYLQFHVMSFFLGGGVDMEEKLCFQCGLNDQHRSNGICKCVPHMSLSFVKSMCLLCRFKYINEVTALLVNLLGACIYGSQC